MAIREKALKIYQLEMYISGITNWKQIGHPHEQIGHPHNQGGHNQGGQSSLIFQFSSNIFGSSYSDPFDSDPFDSPPQICRPFAKERKKFAKFTP